jgi:hypothetical protein
MSEIAILESSKPPSSLKEARLFANAESTLSILLLILDITSSAKSLAGIPVVGFSYFLFIGTAARTSLTHK